MASLNIPHSFSNGNVANATEVNANFASIKAFVETETVQKDGSIKAPEIAINNDAVTNIKIADNAITKSKIDNGPRGIVAFAEVTENNTNISSAEQITLISSSFTAVAGRYYRITYREPRVIMYPYASVYITANIRFTESISGTIASQAVFMTPTEPPYSGGGSIHVTSVRTLPAGPTVFNCTLRSSILNSSSVYRQPGNAAWICVEDLGTM